MDEQPDLKEIEAFLEAEESKSWDFDPIKCLERAQNLFYSAIQKNGVFDARTTEKQGEYQGYFWEVANIFLTRGFDLAAHHFLFGWWDAIGERQLEEVQHLYRAHCAYKLAHSYLQRGDRGAGLRWTLLTQAEDLLVEQADGGVAGKQWLRTVFGMTPNELNDFARIARKNLAKARAGSDANAKAARFSEDVVARLAMKASGFGHLFSEPSSIREFPVSPPYLRTMLERLDAPASSAKAKGDTLEDLACYLFLLIPAWIPRRNLEPEDQCFESDIIVSNLNPHYNLTAELLGRHFLVECKNWDGRDVGVGEVGYFLERMRLTHCRFGIIFAKNNITGKASNAARGLIRRAFHEDGSTCVVLCKGHIQSLIDKETTFWALLLREIEHFRFGIPQ